MVSSIGSANLCQTGRAAVQLLYEALSGPAAVETSHYQTHQENLHAESAR